ncbi:MAG TPA: hypothetical protein VEG39_20725 [Clostridia bacterium]|nr:hypothetical protein [Clostridia bacterium]
MSFNYVEWLMDPFVLMFITVVTGLLFGRIKFGKFRFGTSGALFTGLVIGWFIYGFAAGISAEDKSHRAAQKLINSGVIDNGFFTMFLVLFVVAVGLLAAKDLNLVIRKYGAKFILLGVLITFIGAAATYGMTLFMEDANPYEITGVYTGALTSSPGLAAAIETAHVQASKRVAAFNPSDTYEAAEIISIIDKNLEPSTVTSLTEEQKKQFVINAEAGVGTGYAITYAFGVLIVIFTVTFFPMIFKIDVEAEKAAFSREMAEARASSPVKEIKEVDFDLLAFIIACIFGYTIGLVVIKLGAIGFKDFSLSATGGALIGSLILGYIGRIGFVCFRMNSKILGVIRQVSLAFFLAIVGLKYGYKVFEALAASGAYLVVISLVVGFAAIMSGFLVGRYIFKINWIMLSGAICGGMTSTPGLGAAIDAVGSDDPAAGYGATYPFALLGMVLFTIVMYILPM